LADWLDTYSTLHMWAQVVGKICLRLTPRQNHFWNIAFQVTPRGLSTRPMQAGRRTVTIAFDFIAHQLVITCSDGATDVIPLEPRTVADFYQLVMDTLRRRGIDVHIWPVPVEVPAPVRFDKDTANGSYDPQSANAFWRVLLSTTPVLERFRCDFIGKCSPVHFFWGSMDLAVTRFSGRRAPDRVGADAVTRESYSHEVISHGFWPGSGSVREPAFYAYAAPEPAGFKEARVQPAGAYYNHDFNDFVLPYDAVRSAASPEAALTSFLTTTYEAGANLANWDRTELERQRT
jgi:hypothetical protein